MAFFWIPSWCAVRIPGDKLIRADLRAIKKSVSPAGHLRFAADRGPGGHADRFWALAPALHAARGALYPDLRYEGRDVLEIAPAKGRTIAV